jgi:HlyD family secretion protein
VRYGLPTIVLVTVAAAAVWTVASRPQTAAVTGGPGFGREHGKAIACLGRIQPEDGVFRLSARSLSGQPSIVADLLVKEGEAVRRGQLVAVLNSRDQLEAAWRAAEARAVVERARVAQVKAGAKPADLQAQRAEIARLEVEVAQAQRDYRRYQELDREGVISAAELDDRRLRAETTTQLLAQARERLNSLADIRDVDIARAQADLEAAVRFADQTRAEFEQSQIRSPIDGHVLRIHAWPGEEVDLAGIMEVGKTGRMYVVAEVDELDVPHLKIGQRATISSTALAERLTGVVEYIAPTVVKNDQRDVDPIPPTDARVVETKIRLDAAEKASRLINAQVTVLIER